jgi:hypothetical protein
MAQALEPAAPDDSEIFGLNYLSSLVYRLSTNLFETRATNATGVAIMLAPRRYPGAVVAWLATASSLCHPPGGQDRIRMLGFLSLSYAIHRL